MKAMVIAIDKFTAVRMYEMVQQAQKDEIRSLRKKARQTRNPEEKTRYLRAIKFMEETRMAVVISQEGSDQEEKERFEQEGLNIAPIANSWTIQMKMGVTSKTISKIPIIPTELSL